MPQNQIIALLLKGVDTPEQWVKVISALIQVFIQHFTCLSECLMAVEYDRPISLPRGILGECRVTSPVLKLSLKTRVAVLYQLPYSNESSGIQLNQPYRMIKTALLVLSKDAQLFEITIVERATDNEVVPEQVYVTQVTIESVLAKFGGEGLLSILRKRLELVFNTHLANANMATGLLSEMQTAENVLASLPPKVTHMEPKDE